MHRHTQLDTDRDTDRGGHLSLDSYMSGGQIQTHRQTDKLKKSICTDKQQDTQ
jgi:hypothetical protein